MRAHPSEIRVEYRGITVITKLHVNRVETVLSIVHLVEYLEPYLIPVAENRHDKACKNRMNHDMVFRLRCEKYRISRMN